MLQIILSVIQIACSLVIIWCVMDMRKRGK